MKTEEELEWGRRRIQEKSDPHTWVTATNTNAKYNIYILSIIYFPLQATDGWQAYLQCINFRHFIEPAPDFMAPLVYLKWYAHPTPTKQQFP